ncbi:class I adenylate-forming enzyme family protein [Gordonia rhizosphera]|uniref:Putative fatty-acid--CoA ligase n=1 Tax=Gordonia rhizosphera NBRC 16068 TaxID=1108045 RepID=K6WB04_9ACTN|nr:AMP-binding protein [Gordonia rhizosphera]GAB90941.1 putative fatty-acid--CoA ligase [Gordonia rhizosphera NBRC 16068]
MPAENTATKARYQNWQEMIRDRKSRTPDLLAITDDRADAVTFEELHDRIAANAAGWSATGAGPGDVIAVLGRNSIELVVNAIGIAATGALPMMLNWRLTPAELAQLGSLANPVAVVADEAFTDNAAAVCPSGRRVVLDHRAGSPSAPTSYDQAQQAPVRPLPLPDQETFALLHTSGTTGLPRVIPLTYAGHIWGCGRLSEMVGMTERDVHLRFTPLFHLAGLQEIFTALMSGGLTILREAFDPEQWLDDAEQYGVTFGHLPPVTMRRVLEAWDGRSDKPQLDNLREVWYGTAPADPAMVAQALEVFGCGLRQVYGMTEAQSPVSMLTPEDHLEPDSRLASAGRPLAEWEVRLVDAEGAEVPTGQAGEITVRGRQLFPGYWSADGAPSVVTDADGWYHSGDIGRFDDRGYLFIVDRLKDMIVTGGENVYPAEVEAALIAHPDVIETAVIGIPSDKWGEQVHAVIVLRAGSTASAADLIGFARTRLGGFKVPRSVEIVSELPRNASGKILKRTLRQSHQGIAQGTNT